MTTRAKLTVHAPEGPRVFRYHSTAAALAAAVEWAATDLAFEVSRVRPRLRGPLRRPLRACVACGEETRMVVCPECQREESEGVARLEAEGFDIF